MKVLLFEFFMLLSFGVYGQDFKKLDEKDIDLKQMEFSKKFANDYFSKQISGSYYQFDNDEATAEIMNLLTAEKQKEVYNQLKSGFGEFKSLEYYQILFKNISTLKQ